MMIARVPPPALSHLHPDLQLAGPARSLIGVEKRGTAGAAARDRRPAPHQAPAPPGLGRPRRPRRADPAPAQNAADAPADPPRHRAAVAPPAGHPEMDLPEPGGTAAVSAEITALIERLATAKNGWGYQGDPGGGPQPAQRGGAA